MANITITTTVNSIKVDFGVYASGLAISKGTWSRDEIQAITLNNNHVYVQMKGGTEWPLNYSAQSRPFRVAVRLINHLKFFQLYLYIKEKVPDT